MRKKHILILILIVLSVVIYSSCAEKYYNGMSTKGYNKAPKEWKKPPSRYMSPKKKKLD
jgi:uncharacterized protein YpmB